MSYPQAASPLGITQPGFRYLLDRLCPALHRFLTRIGILSRPPELDELNSYLRNFRAKIENDIRQKTYIPLAGKEVSSRALPNQTNEDPFVQPVHQIIRQIIGRAQGGDSASAEIAAVNRRSRTVRNILKTLLQTDDPLILLGDPGTGKTMTLQQTALALADSEIDREFPIITVYVRLGEFHVEGEIIQKDVMDYIKQVVPSSMQPYIDALDRAGHRLVVLFDGMDEMSRERYSEYTEALSLFAGSRRGVTKTLFSCRITDFSPKFIHRRLVLLPFNQTQITEYLRRYIPVFPILIDGELWTLRKLARRLAYGDLPMEANNPFVLWLLSFQLQTEGTWPTSRVELLRFYNEENYLRKQEDAPQDELPFPKPEKTFLEWGRFAYTITARNRGSAIQAHALHDGSAEQEQYVEDMIRVGKRCGVIVESTDGHEHLIRFEHHRFQEYFTALYVYETQLEISWLNKLDTPRWQETMLNLILMGGANDAVRVLANSIIEPIQTYQDELERVRQEQQRKEQKSGKEDEQEEEKEKEEQGDGKIDLEESEELVEGHRDQGEEDEDEDDGNEEVELEEPRFPEEQETIVADRVELASRIMRQIGSKVSTARETLMPSLREAVSFLVDNGNPITQVKTMRACQNIPDIDFIEALKKPLNSPVYWVRNQALIMVASSQRGARAAGSDLATEIGYDLANGLFLTRLLAYTKAILATGNRRYWWCPTLGLFCYLVNVFLLLGTTALIYVGAATLLGVESLASLLNEAICVTAYAMVVLVAAALALKFEPSLLWATILGSAAGSLALLAAVMYAWEESIFPAAMGLLVGGYIAILLGGIIGMMFHFIILALYLSGTAHIRGSGHTVKSFFDTAWRNCGFEDSMEIFLEGLFELFGGPGFLILLGIGLVLWLLHLFGLLVGLIGLIGLLFENTLKIGLWLGEISHLPFHPFINIVIFVFLISALGFLVSGIVTRKFDHIENCLSLLAIGAILAVVCGLVYSVWGWVTEIRVWIKDVLLVYLNRGIIIFIVLVIFIGFLYSSLLLLNDIIRLMRPRRQVFPPGSFDPEQWKHDIKEANAKKQESLLTRTNHQSLNLNAEGFLTVLRDICDDVKEEPALSTYWDQRDQLEQVLRQERRG